MEEKRKDENTEFKVQSSKFKDEESENSGETSSIGTVAASSQGEEKEIREKRDGETSSAGAAPLPSEKGAGETGEKTDGGTPSDAAASASLKREGRKKSEKRGKVSRRQFLAGGAVGVFGALLGMASGYLLKNEEFMQSGKTADAELERDWDRLPIDILPGAYLVCDPESVMFGGTLQNRNALLTQYIHVCPGMEVLLSRPGREDAFYGWVCYNENLVPIMVFRSSGVEVGEEAANVLCTIPENAYYLRGSCGDPEVPPCIRVRNLAEYLYRCGIGKPDLSGYTEFSGLTVYPHTRKAEDSRLEEKPTAAPAMGDVFFAPAGTDILVTFRNANIVPAFHCGGNWVNLNGLTPFERCCGFGYAWYRCKTTEICNWLSASYESFSGCAKTLTPEELRAADPHVYLRLPGRATQTREAARIRAMDAGSNHKRLFTIVHLTDTHGDIDSTQAGYAYADQIGADFVALTGDYVARCTEHGQDMLHSLIRKAKTPTVYAVGNHDTYYYSDQEVYETNIVPIRDVLQASGAHPYYFRDFLSPEGEKVRVISLYPFYDKAASRSGGYYTKEQLLWLCDVLSTTPAGGHIFILRHFSHHQPVAPTLPDKEEPMFYDHGDSSSEEGINLWLSMDEDPVPAIVDAYNRRESISAEFIGNLEGGRTERIQVNYDFSTRFDSEFVAYLCGHVHIDAIGYVRNARTRQAVLCSLCTTGVKGTEEYHSYTSLNSARDYGTDSQIAFNVFTFHFSEKTIHVARVGNGSFGDRVNTRMELQYVE